jgi:hypothetical protein
METFYKNLNYNIMPRVCLKEFNKEKRNFKLLKEVELASIPTKGDKVTLNIEGIGYVFDVYDVHYTEDARTDVNIIRISDITKYNSSKFPDIILEK